VAPIASPHQTGSTAFGFGGWGLCNLGDSKRFVFMFNGLRLIQRRVFLLAHDDVVHSIRGDRMFSGKREDVDIC
jgi:hypothetical protein